MHALKPTLEHAVSDNGYVVVKLVNDSSRAILDQFSSFYPLPSPNEDENKPPLKHASSYNSVVMER